ncbi:MAG TPA: hypothetical protein VIK61_08230 [Acidimicrobiia bacterium]
MRGRGRSIGVAACCALLLSGVAAAAGASTVGASAEPGLAPVTLAGHRYLVRPHSRAGVKAIVAGARPAISTLAVRSSARKGVVTPKPAVYVVFWGSQWSNDPAGAAAALQQFFAGLYGAPDTWGTILSQYCEGVPEGTTNCAGQGIPVVHPTQSTLRGVWFDNAAAAPRKATANQLAAEAVAAAEHFGNTTQKLNLDAQYVVASPTGTHPDGFPRTGFCAWHNFTSSPDGNVAYTNLPYVPDLGVGGCTTIRTPTALDGDFSTETHEYAETVTDPWPLRGWSASGSEIGDECVQLDARLTLATGTFDVQGLWSNAANGCTTTG